MIVKLGASFGAGGESEIVVGLTLDDVAKLRAGDQLTVRPRDAGLLFHDEIDLDGREPRAVVLAFGTADTPKQPGHLCVTESMLAWLRDSVPLSNKLEDLGCPSGKLILVHRATDDDTAAEVERYLKILARTGDFDTSDVTAIKLDRETGHVSVTRVVRLPKTPASHPRREPNWAPVVACSVAVVASIWAAATQPDNRVLGIVGAIVFAAIAAWTGRTAWRLQRLSADSDS